MPRVICPMKHCKHNRDNACHAAKIELNHERVFARGQEMNMFSCASYCMSDGYAEILKLGWNVRGTDQKNDMPRKVWFYGR